MFAAAATQNPEQSSRMVLTALPLPVYTTDGMGRITFYNDAAARLWGREPVLLKERWCAALRLYDQEGQVIAPEHGPVAAALANRQGSRTDVMLEHADGTRRDISLHATPLFDARGAVTGAVVLLEDMTERKQAERNHAHLSAIVESSEDAILSKSLDGHILTWNKGAERIFGYTAAEAVGKSVLMLIPDERHSEEPRILARIRRGERVEHFETVRRRKDGSLIDISLSISPVKNDRGEIIGASKVARDISGRRRLEEERERLHLAARQEVAQRKKAEETKDLLLHEIKHRMKNTLGTVQAIASQTFRGAPQIERDAFGARLRAMADAHDLLTNQDWGLVMVRDIVSRAIAPFNPARFDTDGDDTALNSTKALLLAMAIHELGTNAVKYGALSNTLGRVAIGWRGDGGHLVLDWRETGGPGAQTPTHKGFGTNLIQRAIAGQQGGAVFDYTPGGLKVRLDIRF